MGMGVRMCGWGWDGGVSRTSFPGFSMDPRLD